MGASELKEEPLSKSKFILRVRVLGGIDFHYTFHQLVADIERKMATLLCSECGKSFTEAATLFIHQSRTHDKTTYSCDECGTDVIGKVTINNHKRRHKRSGDILSQDKLSQGIYCPGTKRPRDKMSPYLTLFCCSRRGHIVPGDILSQYRKGTYCPRRHIVPGQNVPPEVCYDSGSWVFIGTGIFGSNW